MRIALNGRNIDITPALREYVEEKIGRIVNHYDQIQSLEVTLSVNKNPSVALNHTAEVSCLLNGAKLHVEETAETMYASIDLVADILNRQVIKHKEKLLKGKTKTESIRTEAYEAAPAEEEVETEE